MHQTGVVKPGSLLTMQCEDEGGTSTGDIHPPQDHSWLSNGDTSTLAHGVEAALAAATTYHSTASPEDTNGDHLRLGIINTLLAAIAILDTPPGNPNLEEISTDVLDNLRQGGIKPAIKGLARIANPHLVGRAPKAIRDPVHAEDADAGRKASESIDHCDHSDVHGIIQRARRSVAQSDILSRVMHPRARRLPSMARVWSRLRIQLTPYESE